MPDNKVTVTFEGDTLAEAMQSARTEAHGFLHMLERAKIQAIQSGDYVPEGNGVSKEDTVIHGDKALDNDAVLLCALDLLMTVYASGIKTIDGKSTTAAVDDLLEKYGVDSLNDVEPEKASDLFKDAEAIARVYGVSN